MKLKKDKKFIFFSSSIAVICFFIANIIDIVESGFKIIENIIDLLMLFVVVNIMIKDCFTKKY